MNATASRGPSRSLTTRRPTTKSASIDTSHSGSSLAFTSRYWLFRTCSTRHGTRYRSASALAIATCSSTAAAERSAASAERADSRRASLACRTATTDITNAAAAPAHAAASPQSTHSMAGHTTDPEQTQQLPSAA